MDSIITCSYTFGPNKVGTRAIEGFSVITKITIIRSSPVVTKKPLKPQPQLFQELKTPFIEFQIIILTSQITSPTLGWEQQLTNFTRWCWNFHPKPKAKPCTSSSTGGHMTANPPIRAVDLYQASLLLSRAYGPKTNRTSSNSSQQH